LRSHATVHPASGTKIVAWAQRSRAVKKYFRKNSQKILNLGYNIANGPGASSKWLWLGFLKGQDP
jgi:hypothetical protein